MAMTCVRSFNAALINSLRPTIKTRFLQSLTSDELTHLKNDWAFWAREDQMAPAGDWVAWIILGGRGAGKTRAGAEWVRAHVEGQTPLGGGQDSQGAHVALIGETYSDVRDVMVEGPSGLLAIAPSDRRPRHEPSRRRVIWPNGAVATYYSSEDPDGLRGPQFTLAWADEFAKWQNISATWDNLQFALRLGERPRQVVTTTPRPIKELKRLMAHANSVVTRASTYANRANLAAGFFDAVIAQYEGTRLGRQELNAEILEDNPNALWQRGMFEAHRTRALPELTRVVVAVDPPVSSGAGADECGIIVAGRGADGLAYVLEDATCQGASPTVWAGRAVVAYYRHDADRLVVEVNQGGDMVKTVIGQVDGNVAYKAVRASRGKVLRAEPVAALYEQGRVRHGGVFPALEDQMCAFDSENARARSPDRVDALVWALTELMLSGEAGKPKVRNL